MITHVFFDLFGTLVNPRKLLPCYSSELGRIMTQRYGNHPKEWMEAHLRVMEDWDSYYADLDLGGENGMAHMWEGLYRTTRALFRLTNTKEPSKKEISELSRELPGLASGNCDALYTDVRPIMDDLCNANFKLGITTHALTAQARALLNGGNIQQYFKGQIFGVDATEAYTRDENYFTMIARLVEVQPERCLVVDGTPHYVTAAQAAGMQGVFIYRNDPPFDIPDVDLVLAGDLRPLLDYLNVRLTPNS